MANRFFYPVVRRVALAAALVGFFVGAAFARAPQDVPKSVGVVPKSGPMQGQTIYTGNFALFVGIGTYQNRQIPNIKSAPNDAKTMRDLLVTKYGFDADPDRTVVLTDQTATKDRIDREIARLCDSRRVKPTDRVLIYFSCHGQGIPLPNGNKLGYLIPYDATVDLKDLTNAAAFQTSCLDMEDVVKRLQSCPARHRTAIVDSCFSGFAAGTKALFGANYGPDTLRSMLGQAGLVVMTAGDSEEEAEGESSETGLSLFTRALVDTLNEGSLNGGTFTVEQLAAEAAAKTLDRSSGRQKPQYGHKDGSGQMLLFSSAPATPAPAPVSPSVAPPNTVIGAPSTGADPAMRSRDLVAQAQQEERNGNDVKAADLFAEAYDANPSDSQVAEHFVSKLRNISTDGSMRRAAADLAAKTYSKHPKNRELATLAISLLEGNSDYLGALTVATVAQRAGIGESPYPCVVAQENDNAAAKQLTVIAAQVFSLIQQKSWNEAAKFATQFAAACPQPANCGLAATLDHLAGDDEAAKRQIAGNEPIDNNLGTAYFADSIFGNFPELYAENDGDDLYPSLVHPFALQLLGEKDYLSFWESPDIQDFIAANSTVVQQQQLRKKLQAMKTPTATPPALTGAAKDIADGILEMLSLETAGTSLDGKRFNRYAYRGTKPLEDAIKGKSWGPCNYFTTPNSGYSKDFAYMSERMLNDRKEIWKDTVAAVQSLSQTRTCWFLQTHSVAANDQDCSSCQVAWISDGVVYLVQAYFDFLPLDGSYRVDQYLHIDQRPIEKLFPSG